MNNLANLMMNLIFWEREKCEEERIGKGVVFASELKKRLLDRVIKEELQVSC